MENPLTHEIRDWIRDAATRDRAGKRTWFTKGCKWFCEEAEKLYQSGTANGDNPLYQWLSSVPFAPLLVLSISACEASQKDVAGAKAGQQAAANHATDQPATANNQGKNVTNDQAPINQRFRSLDEYLAHLEQMEGPVGGPWYKEIRPGIYELQTGNLHLDVPGGEKRTFTRAELERKFGFSK